MDTLYTKEIAGIEIGTLAERFATPLYVYDQAVIEQRISELRDFGVIRFAMKSLSNIAVLALMRSRGVVVDCVSTGEMFRAIAAGYQPGKRPPEMVYTCDIFDPESLDFVLENDVAVNIGSIDMIEQYGSRGGKQPLTLRVNPGFGHGHSQKTNTGGPSSKHGIWHEEIANALAAAGRFGLSVEGVHMHIGSGADFEHLASVCAAMRDAVLQIGPSVQMISAGGGLPIPYRQDDQKIDLAKYKSLWWELRDRLSADLGHPLVLEVEPGRFLTAEAGYLLTEVRAVKSEGENTFYLVDAGFNNLARPVMYGSYHQISLCPRNASDCDALQAVVVGGPLCESGDVFTQREGGYVEPRKLPRASVGDYLVIQDAGAYGFVMSSNYNSKPHAAEVLIADGQAHLIRERQPLEDLIKLEKIPPDLGC